LCFPWTKALLSGTLDLVDGFLGGLLDLADRLLDGFFRIAERLVGLSLILRARPRRRAPWRGPGAAFWKSLSFLLLESEAPAGRPGFESSG